MSKTINYYDEAWIGAGQDEFLAWLRKQEEKENITLYPYQIHALWQLINGKKIRMATGLGQTTIFKFYGAYCDYMQDKYPPSEPDLCYDYRLGQVYGIYAQGVIENMMKSEPKEFLSNYKCKGAD